MNSIKLYFHSIIKLIVLKNVSLQGHTQQKKLFQIGQVYYAQYKNYPQFPRIALVLAFHTE